MAAPINVIGRARFMPIAMLRRLQEIKFMNLGPVRSNITRLMTTKLNQRTPRVNKILFGDKLRLCCINRPNFIYTSTNTFAIKRKWKNIDKELKDKNTESQKLNPMEMVQIFDSSNKMICRLTLIKAKERALHENMKLIEMGRNSDDVLSFYYLNGEEFREATKKAKLDLKKNNTRNEVKGMRLSLTISDHDLDIKLKQCAEIMSKGYKMKIKIKGNNKLKQEMVHQLQSEILTRVRERLEGVGIIKQSVKEGNQLTVDVQLDSTSDKKV